MLPRTQICRKSQCKGEKVENGVNDMNNSENEQTRVNGGAPIKP